jgi:phage tail protein X
MLSDRSRRQRHQANLVTVYDQLLGCIEADNEAPPGYAGEDPHLTGSPA